MWRYLISLLALVINLGTVDCQITRNFDCRSNGCCDQHEWCTFWATKGQCTTNAEWMIDNCQFACKTCPAKGGVAPASPAAAPMPSMSPPAAAPAAPPPNPAPAPAQAPAPAPAPAPAAAPAFQGNNLARCQEVIRNDQNFIATASKEGLLSEREDVSFRRTFSVQDIINSNNQFGCAPQQSSLDCSRNSCYHLRYRTLDGTCNSLSRPTTGAAATPYMRLKAPVYDDGVAALVASVKGGRPSPRDASRFILASRQDSANTRLSAVVLQFGQFIVHDIVKTSPMDGKQCDGCTAVAGRCAPIQNRADDPHCKGQACCQAFTRAAPVCGTGSNTPRLQLNVVTSFLDASLVYGSAITDSDPIRNGAFMSTTQFNGKQFMPFDSSKCSGPGSCDISFKAGDDRNAIYIALTAFHVLMVREHNRLASELQRRNPRWSADRLFQEARKIVGAEMQAIAYKEWLPKLLGRSLEAYNGYDPNVDSTVANEFVHSAMRFGHGFIPEFFNRADGNGGVVGSQAFLEGVLSPHKMLFEGGIDPILRGLTTMPLKIPQRITPSMTERMFGSTDMAAVHIQRGREVGLSSYNDMREFCGLRRASNFNDFSREISDANVRNSMQNLYTNPDNVDLYVGGLVEDAVPGGVIGPTFSCIISNQFRRCRNGDRFWYQNPFTFTPGQLAQLERVTLARIICDNGDAIRSMPADAFLFGVGPTPCNALPGMDLSAWQE